MTIFLANDDIAAVLEPGPVIEALDSAYRAFAGGDGVCPPRLDLQAAAVAGKETYQLGLSIGLSGAYGAIRIKSDMVFQRLVAGLPRKEKYCTRPGLYCGLILLFSTADGAPLALLHDGLLQRMRVAADSAIGVRYMAREDARTLGILGAGGMAESHARAIAQVRALERVVIFSPTEANREGLAKELRASGIPAEAATSAEAVMRSADILAACTNSTEAVVIGGHLQPGVHVTAIGGKLDGDASARVHRALRLGAANAPLEHPDWRSEEECLTFAIGGSKAAGGSTRRFADVPEDRSLSLADILADPSAGRTSREQITFSERGNIHGLQFAAAAGQIFERAREQGLGVELGASMFLQDIRN